MAQEFETLMKLLADTTDPNQAVPNRYAVTGTSLTGGGSGGGSGSSGSGSGSSDATTWISSWNVAESHYDHLKTTGTWDVWWQGWWRDAGWNYEVVVAAKLNDSWFNAPNDPWQQFSLGPQYILNGITGSPYQSNQFSPASFTYAGKLVSDLTGLIQYWQQQFHTWADKVDVSGSDWQGSAAGVFRHMLQTFESQLGALNAQMTPSSLSTALDNLTSTMSQNATTASQAFYQWHGAAANWPSTNVSQVLQDTMNSSQVSMHYEGISHGHPTPRISTPLGDPTTQDFWTAVENHAKQNWLATLSNLDTTAQQVLSALDGAYQGANNAVVLSTAFTAPPQLGPGSSNNPNGPGGGSGGNGDGNVNIPPITIPNPGGGGPGGGGPSGGPSGSSASNGDTKIPNFDIGGGPGGSNGSHGPAGPGGPGNADFSSSGSKNPKDGPNGLPNPLANLPKGPADFSVSGSNGSGNPGGGADTVTGPNGSTVLGPNGLPLTVPAGSTISPDGEVIGPDGKPVLGPNGKPLTVSKGSKLNPDENLGDSKPSPGGGSHGPAEDFSIGGSALGGGPKSFVSDVPNAGLFASGGGGGGGSFGAIGGSKPPGPLGSGSFGGSAGAAGGPPASTARLIGSAGGMSDRAASMGGEAGSPSELNAAGETPAELEATQAAAEEEQALSRVPTVGGAGAPGDEAPFMPPMTGGMGGGGGGTGGAKKTWVTEDEDAWGTTTAGSGVIGRR